jgi:sigma-E factor negative regulatory protein RseC
MATNGIISQKQNGKIHIKITDNMNACEGCAAHALCGKKDCDEAQIILKDRDDLQINDEVIVEEAGGLLIKTSLIAYGVPLLFFIAGVFLGMLIPEMSIPKELIQFLTGCVGLIIGGFVGRWISHLVAKQLDKNMIVKKL